MLQKHFKLEVKSVDADGTFTGYASVTGNIDSDNEVIDKGAFKRTIDHTKGVVPILWQHDRNQPVGWNTDASEDGFGLAVKGKLMTDTELGRYAQSFLKTGLEVGAKPGLSIGFTVPKEGSYYKDGIRHFKEVALKEYSIVTFQANELATATSAKADSKTKRVAGEDLTADCFAYVGDSSDISTWKLPIKFSTEEKTTSHIRNALARFGQTQGIPESEKAGVLAKIKRAAKEHGIDTGDKSAKAATDNVAEVEDALEQALQDIYSNDDMDDNERQAAVSDAYDNYGDDMTDYHMQCMGAGMKHQKSGRAISAATAAAVKDAHDTIDKGLGKLKPLFAQPAHSYLANDTYSANPMGDGKAEQSADAAAKDHASEDLLNLLRSVADGFKSA